MKTNEEILYDYCYNINIKKREEAIQLLSQKSFRELKNNYSSYIGRTRKLRKLNFKTLNFLINELQDIKNNLLPNESLPEIYIDSFQEESKYSELEDCIYMESYLYNIVDISRLEFSAKHFVKNCMWKLKYQTNGKDAIRYQKIIDNYNEKNKVIS